MTKKKTPTPIALTEPRTRSSGRTSFTRVEETPFEAVASICSVLVVGLYILTFLGQNFVIWVDGENPAGG